MPLCASITETNNSDFSAECTIKCIMHYYSNQDPKNHKYLNKFIFIHYRNWHSTVIHVYSAFIDDGLAACSFIGTMYFESVMAFSYFTSNWSEFE